MSWCHWRRTRGIASTRCGSTPAAGRSCACRRACTAKRRATAGERSEAERILLEADFGVEATEEILDRVSGAKDGDHDFRSALERAVIGALTPAAPSVAPGALAHAPAPPTVILVFGVNGVGKTTAVAKLGARLAHEGRSVLFAAADTFRAGAAEQLQVWADRLGVPCITGTKDPP